MRYTEQEEEPPTQEEEEGATQKRPPLQGMGHGVGGSTPAEAKKPKPTAIDLQALPPPRPWRERS